MTVSQTLSNLGDAVRNLTWKTDKMSVTDMTTAINLSSSLPNLAAPFSVMNDGKGHVSTTNTDGSQSFIGQGGFAGELVHVNGGGPTVALKKGDTLVQAFTIKANVFKGVYFNFDGVATYTHTIRANTFKIADDTYRVWATYMAPQDEQYKLFEFWADAKATTGITLSNPYAAIVGVGGEINANLLDLNKFNYIKSRYSEGILSFDSGDYDFSKPGSSFLDFVTEYHFKMNSESSYRLSLMARGKGLIETYIFGNTKSGTYVDNRNNCSLTDNWKSYDQVITPDSVPLDASFLVRTHAYTKSEIADLQLIKVS